ncbi:hypothetical protein Q9L58_005623 [Maublancomyces gigas]|uniref:Retrotransposon Copia-like N-terminal domain-containing protein n=1 Tax=Discina gigas TaxID=1032678 RepID=A0ABR3GHN8_9PEZI
MSDFSDRDEKTGIQHLKGDSNFYVWKHSVKNKLVSYNYWNITSGATPRPTYPSSESMTSILEGQRVWDIWSCKAMCIICNILSPEVSRSISSHETAPAMWDALMQRFHHHEPHDLLKSFNAICSLRYSDDSTESFRDYLAFFEERWDDLRYRCDDADPPVAGTGNSLETSLNVLTNSDQSKREFLIASLPKSMLSIVCNPQFEARSQVNYTCLCSALVRYNTLMESRKE